MRDLDEVDDPIADTAAEQEGVIARLQALALGMSTDAIDARLKSGRWRRLFPGVYATFTGPPGRPASLWAALLVCGRGAVLSHETAAELWGLRDPAVRLEPEAEPEPVRPVHVTIPSGRRVKAPAGIVLHHSSRLATSRHPGRRPPCTRVEDTVVDLTQSARYLDAAIAVITEAVRHRATTHQRLLAALDSRKKLRWRTQLTEACTVAGTGAHSLLEFRFVMRVERPHGLPKTRRQVRLRSAGATVFVDARDDQHRVRIELDGVAGHTGDGAFRDMRRDNAAAAEGDVTVRFGWDDVTVRPCETAALLARVYTARGWTGTPTRCGPACPLPAP